MSKCRLFHDWSHWKLVEVTYATGSFDYTSKIDRNERQCQRCKKVQRKGV